LSSPSPSVRAPGRPPARECILPRPPPRGLVLGYRGGQEAPRCNYLSAGFQVVREESAVCR
jgi:hypothetical protein